ncbi:MAG: type II toxin-antitoxin system RelE/ParE family toxin [Chloroflexi bacterium]|nr:type II toxin-antitoxin system RelE/ParE family toxin [Chloroflexota bacterium]
MHRLLFAPKARRAFLEFQPQDMLRIKAALDRLQEDLRMPGVVRLREMRVAQYRYRVGDFRLLFDINDREQSVVLLDIRRRNERTYR